MNAPQFTFAGFTFPRAIAMLPSKPLAQRLADFHKPRFTGPYYHAPKPNTSGASFYLDSDFMPGLRWAWADDVARSIRHTGWYTDEHGIGDTVRGLVMRLPHGRGFLAGWSMGEHMASEVETDHVYDDETDAALAADSIAERVAEREREYQAREMAECDE